MDRLDAWRIIEWVPAPVTGLAGLAALPRYVSVAPAPPPKVEAIGDGLRIALSDGQTARVSSWNGAVATLTAKKNSLPWRALGDAPVVDLAVDGHPRFSVRRPIPRGLVRVVARRVHVGCAVRGVSLWILKDDYEPITTFMLRERRDVQLPPSATMLALVSEDAPFAFSVLEVVDVEGLAPRSLGPAREQVLERMAPDFRRVEGCPTLHARRRLMELARALVHQTTESLAHANELAFRHPVGVASYLLAGSIARTAEQPLRELSADAAARWDGMPLDDVARELLGPTWEQALAAGSTARMKPLRQLRAVQAKAKELGELLAASWSDKARALETDAVTAIEKHDPGALPALQVRLAALEDEAGRLDAAPPALGADAPPVPRTREAWSALAEASRRAHDERVRLVQLCVDYRVMPHVEPDAEKLLTALPDARRKVEAAEIPARFAIDPTFLRAEIDVRLQALDAEPSPSLRAETRMLLEQLHARAAAWLGLRTAVDRIAGAAPGSPLRLPYERGTLPSLGDPARVVDALLCEEIWKGGPTLGDPEWLARGAAHDEVAQRCAPAQVVGPFEGARWATANERLAAWQQWQQRLTKAEPALARVVAQIERTATSTIDLNDVALTWIALGAPALGKPWASERWDVAGLFGSPRDPAVVHHVSALVIERAEELERAAHDSLLAFARALPGAAPEIVALGGSEERLRTFLRALVDSQPTTPLLLHARKVALRHPRCPSEPSHASRRISEQVGRIHPA